MIFARRHGSPQEGLSGHDNFLKFRVDAAPHIAKHRTAVPENVRQILERGDAKTKLIHRNILARELMRGRGVPHNEVRLGINVGGGSSHERTSTPHR
jgi:hypothetical protein